jgi:hypothetical protein
MRCVTNLKISVSIPDVTECFIGLIVPAVR